VSAAGRGEDEAAEGLISTDSVNSLLYPGYPHRPYDDPEDAIRNTLREEPMKRAILALFGIVAMAGAAKAGIADSPLPNIGGATATLHMYSVPGVINGGGLGTYFLCTSTSTAAIRVGVELFAPGGGSPLNDASTTAVTVPAGGTVTFGTTPGGINVDQNLSAGLIRNGSARILSSSKLLICSAVLADTVNASPGSLANLTIVYKLKQKGQ
jgi:hypothetical protein